MSPVVVPSDRALRRAATRAMLAPSIFNTQPWRLELFVDRLEFHVDHTRMLAALDVEGRQRTLSIGCALFNARVSLAAADLVSETALLPDPTSRALLAEVRVTEAGAAPPDEASRALALLDDVIERRQTRRYPFTDEAVPDSVVKQLAMAVEAEGAELVLCAESDRAALTEAADIAEAARQADPAALAELFAWVASGPAPPNGVAVTKRSSLGPAPSLKGRSGFTRPVLAAPADSRQCLLTICTKEDEPESWLRAGQALQRLLLEATALGYATGMPSETIEVPPAREHFRASLGKDLQPHAIVRLGRAPDSRAVGRRRMVDVIVDSSESPLRG